MSSHLQPAAPESDMGEFVGVQDEHAMQDDLGWAECSIGSQLGAHSLE